MKISLCLIVWNELQGCKIDIPNIPLDQFDEVFAIDGGSTDGTVEFLEDRGIKVIPQEKRGLNAAYVQANQCATCDFIVVFFPKGTIPTEDLLKFKPFFNKGFELVIASRQIKGSINEEDANFLKTRKWAVKGLAHLSAVIWKKNGMTVLDVLHGVKGWKKEAFNEMRILNHGLSIDIEMVVRSYKLNIDRVEFPTTEIARSYGTTHFKIWPTGKRLLRYLWFELWRKD